jgi:hypothetical protein
MTMMSKVFPISKDTMVVTSTYVTNDREPVRYVSRQDDEEGGELWQFHSGNGDYSMEKLQLVRLDTILRLDPSVGDVADLPLGFNATRADRSALWKIEKE